MVIGISPSLVLESNLRIYVHFILFFSSFFQLIILNRAAHHNFRLEFISVRVCVSCTLLITFSGTLSVIGVVMNPGNTQLHRIPNLDKKENVEISISKMISIQTIAAPLPLSCHLLSSLAAVRVKPSTPALEAA